METKRSTFSGKIGFVLAAAGSAVGLGNIWRFPYLAAKYGGGIFLLVYIILAVTFGFSLVVAEIAIGRKTGLSPIGAFRKLDKRFTFVGYLAAIVPALILPYYSVIGGWVAKYFVVFLSGQGSAAAGDDYFSAFTAQPFEPLGWFFLFIAATALIVLFGVNKGVEKVSSVMMPILVVLTLFVAIYSACMPGAWEGVLYYITPDFSKFSVMTVVAAMGQLFYSMSIAMGIMITYGSYMKKDVNIESSVHQIEIFDTGIAFLAGLMVIPSVFVFSLVLGLPSSLGFGVWSAVAPLGMDILTFFDFLTNSVMMPVVAFFTCLVVGYIVKTPTLEEELEASAPFRGKKMFRAVIRYIAPICILLILVSSLLDAFGIVSI